MTYFHIEMANQVASQSTIHSTEQSSPQPLSSSSFVSFLYTRRAATQPWTLRFACTVSFVQVLEDVRATAAGVAADAQDPGAREQVSAAEADDGSRQARARLQARRRDEARTPVQPLEDS